MLVCAVDWTEVTAIATAVLALGLVGALGAAVFAAQQVREARISREALMAAEFFRRWNDDALVEARRMFARYSSPEELRDAFAAYVAVDAPRPTSSTANSTSSSSSRRSRAAAHSTSS